MLAKSIVSVCMGVACLTCTAGLVADENVWLEDYGDAMSLAKRTNRMMLVYFYKDDFEVQQSSLCKKLTDDERLKPLAAKHVLVRLPVSYRSQVNGEQIQLIRHRCFAELRGKPGFAVIDFEDPSREYYGHVISIYPLSLPGAQTVKNLRALLSLPTGSLTQRTLILAVRIHPEGPQSTDGTMLATLAHETESHSLYQARITNQGHHNWESRFHRINGEIPGGGLATEVCAESWPGEGLIAAAIDCVQSWRQSSGHWSAVRRRHQYYGYDMKRGRNGIWYATGIFSSR